MITRKRASETRVLSKSDTGNHEAPIKDDKQVSGSSTVKSKGPAIRVRVKKYLGVAHWTWNCGDEEDVCSICQNPFEGVAPGVKYPGDDSAVVFGKCGHAFHLQCVNTWLNTRSTCPFCRGDWEFGAEKTVESGS
jgi:anaphase-promoting complex subunit 11